MRIEEVNEPIPVGNIYCLGRNYRAHAAEMGGEVPAEPIIFLKPPTAVIDESDLIRLPPFSKEIHHEVEMVVLLGMEGRNIPEEEAMDYVAAYGVGLDLTARDLQAEAKKKGMPWAVSKGFDGAAPVSRFVRAASVPDPHNLDMELKVNGTTRQRSSTSLMIFRIPTIIAYLSGIFTVSPGDLIFTGTPEGVGPIGRGDHLDLSLGDSIHASFRVSAD